MIGKKLVSVISVLSLSAGLVSVPAAAYVGTDENLLVSEDFENPMYSEGMSLKLVSSEWTVKDSNEGDSVTVEKDPVTGSMAAKITQKFYEKKQSGNPETGFEIPIPTVNEGTVETSFKIRCDSPTSVLGQSFIFDSDNNRCGTFYQYKQSIFAEDIKNYLIDLASDKYVSFVITYDMTNNKYDIKCSNGSKEYTFAQDKEIKDISALKFMISANWTNTAEGYINQSTQTPPVYWVDDISVRIKSLEVSQFQRSENDFYIMFNDEPADTFINTDWFEMYCEDEKLSDYTVTKLSSDAKTVLVSMNSIKKYGANYTLKVKSGIAAANGSTKALSEDFSKTIKIIAPNVIAKENFDSYKEGLKLSEINNGWIISDSNEGDSVTVEKDPKNNTNAVKITQSKQTPAQSGNPYTGFKIDFPAQTSGIVEMKFKLRCDAQTALLNPELVTGKGGFGSAAVYIYQTLGDVYFDRSLTKYIGKRLVSDTYVDFDIIFNLDDKKVTVNGKESSYAVSEVSSLNFRISANWGEGGEGWMSSEGDPVYWVDDISIEKKCIDVTEISNSGREFYVDFNTEPADSSLTNEFFKIYSKGSEMSDVTIRKDETDPKRVILSLKDAAEYDVFYNVVLKSGIKAANTSYMDTFADSEKAFTVKSQTELVNESFNDIDDIAAAHSDWTVKENGGGAVSVENDPMTGDKALKIVNPEGNMSENGIIIPFESKKSGKVKISYKLRTDNNSSLLTGFTLTGANDYNRAAYLQFKNDLYLYGAIKWQDYKFTTMSDKYQKIDITADLDNGTYSAAVDGIIRFKNVPLSNSDTTADLAKIKMLISDNYNAWGASEAFKTGLSGDGVYWIDDISAYSYTYPEIVDSSVANGAEKVACDSVLTYRFDRDIAGVDYSNLHVYKNGMLLGEDEYRTQYSDRTVTVTIADGLQYATDYEIVFDNTIESVTGEKCKDSYIFKFTTEDNPDAVLLAEAVNANGAVIEDLSEYKGEKINVKASINPNLDGYTFIAVIKDSKGVIKDAALTNSENVKDSQVTLELDVPQDADENYVVQGFIWDSVSQKPLQNRLDLVKKNSNLKIYVSIAAESGGDGSIERPFNDLTAARDYARTQKTQSSRAEIIIKSGTYNITDGFSLGEEDNYTLYRAYGNDTPVLSGGNVLSLSDFSVSDDARLKDEVKGKVYKINLSEKGIEAPKLNIIGHSTEELKSAGFSAGSTDSIVTANGAMLRPARYPNEGYMTVKSVLQNGSAANKQPMKFSVDTDTSKWGDKNAMVFGYWYYDWSDQSAPVASIENNVITTTVPSGYGIREGQKFYIYNLLEELDVPGEWYYDKETGDFFIYPPENCRQITVCSKSCNLIDIFGAQSIELRGLSLENSGYDGISIRNSKYVTVSNCEVKNTAGYGIKAYGNNIAVLENTVHSTGTSGIGTGGGNTATLTPCANVIRGNRIYDTSKIVTRYTPNLRIEGVGVKAEMNKLYNAPHCAVIFGGNDHVIAKNEIYNVLCDSSDSGAIYSGRSMIRRGTEITENYIHDLKTSSGYGLIYGIYLDDCMSGISMRKNRFENISGTGIFINGGRNNEAADNVFINISENGIELSTAGMTDWYGNDEKFINTMGLSDGVYKSTPYLKYPGLYNILEDDVRMPKYNVIKRNSYTDCKDGVVIKIFDAVTNEKTVRDVNTVE